MTSLGEKNYLSASCYLCDNFVLKIGGTGSDSPDLLECAVCGLGQFQYLPSEADLKDYYSSKYSQYLEDAAAAYDDDPDPVFDRFVGELRILEASPQGRTIRSYLELGTGFPIRAACLTSAGLDTVGIEPFGPARIWGEGHGVSMFPNLSEVEGTFDWCHASHVIEHLRDPLDTLREIVQRMGADSVLSGAVPNWQSIEARCERMQWEWFQYPTHLWQFTPISLHLLLERSGLRVTRLWSDAPAEPRYPQASWLRNLATESVARSLAGPELKFHAQKQ